tara:strand:+ start:832 stop:1395 length:564 start_codon:yes stop_codon:yes gene_type:complete
MKKSIEEFKKDHSDIYKFLTLFENRENNHFLQDVYNHLSKKGEISIKQINGIRNSMLYVQRKEEREQLIEKHKNDEPNGYFVGKEKQRYNMTLKYLSTIGTSRGYFVHNFTDKEGNSLMCFSDNEKIRIQEPVDGVGVALSEGDCFTCRATVNRHTISSFDPTYKVKQTVLNRIKYYKYLGNKNNEK